MTTIRAFIVDDEKSARENIIGALNHYCAKVEVLGQANSVKDALGKIEKLRPDLLFLDVEIGSQLVFELLEALGYKPDLVFVTGHEKYALEAIKADVVYYLVKPIVPKDLVEAVARARVSIQKKKLLQQLELLIGNNPSSRLSIPGKDKYRITNINDLIYCEADNNYTHFYLSNGEKVVASKTLKSFETQLLDNGFFRVHQSYLVNMAWADQFDKKNNSLLLENGVQIPVAQRRRTELMRMLENLVIS